METDNLDEAGLAIYQKRILQLGKFFDNVVAVIKKSKILKENCWSLHDVNSPTEQKANVLCSLKSIEDFTMREKIIRILDDIKEQS